MNNLGKLIIGLSLIPAAHLSAAEEGGRNPQTGKEIKLDVALKEYHPEVLKSIKNQHADIAVLEASSKDIKGNENNAVKDESFDAVELGKLAITPAPLLLKIPTDAAFNCRNSGGIFLENNYVATCVSPNGTFGNGYNSIGMTFNPSGSGTVTSNDFLQPGSPYEYFSFSTLGYTLTNNNTTPSASASSVLVTPGSLLSPSAVPSTTTISPLDRYTPKEGGVLVKSTYGSPSGYHLTMTQKYTLDPNSREIIVNVEMHNTGANAFPDLMYARGLDADVDLSSHGTYHTLNRIGHRFLSSGPAIDVSPDNIAWAEGVKSHLFVALYSVDPVAHKTCINSTWGTGPITPDRIWSHDCGLFAQPVYDQIAGFSGSDYSDSTINMAFKVGHLNVGEKKSFSFKYLFGKSKKHVVKPLEPFVSVK
ncbi:MAG: hypothetical protein KAG19_05935 [Methylococcales bacterium]|nr:hypothetical protein [Methylococcales bacterium]